jgi:hypothetical protein
MTWVLDHPALFLHSLIEDQRNMADTRMVPKAGCLFSVLAPKRATWLPSLHQRHPY